MADFDKFPEAFRAAGLAFTEEPGWRTRGHGDINDVRFIVIHHTASANNDAAGINPVRDGVAGLEGPLSQLCLKRNGQPHIIAQGVCWHAYGTINYRGVAPKQGNYWSIGIEGIDSGYNTWTEEQRVGYPKVVASLLKYMKLPPDAWIFHRDYQPGEKIDPGGFDKAWFDRQVRAAYNNVSEETAIQAKRRENPWLGAKLTKEEELPTADGVGRFAEYENGHIYWHPNFGARTVNKNIWPKFEANQWEQGFLGYPQADAIKINGGEAQAFQGGSIYYNDVEKQGYVLMGAIGSRWAELNWENGPLGFPQTDEITLPDGVGKLQRYQNGHIYHHPTTGAKEIYFGSTWEEFARLDYEKGSLGYPVGIPIATQDRRGTVQTFQNGAVYALNSVAMDGHAITGGIFEIYGQLGYENGRLGMPISDVYIKDKRVERADFEAGSIERDLQSNDIYMVLAGKRVDIKPTEPEVVVPPVVTPPVSNKWQETNGEHDMLPESERKGGISFFANTNDPSTKGRTMGISGESADKPIDQWYCAMRFAYVDWEIQPNGWYKPKNKPGSDIADRITWKNYLMGRKLKITNPQTGKSIVVRPADVGPGVPKRVVDVSETAINALGAKTDDQVVIEWVDPKTPLGPVK